MQLKKIEIINNPKLQRNQNKQQIEHFHSSLVDPALKKCFFLNSTICSDSKICSLWLEWMSMQCNFWMRWSNKNFQGFGMLKFIILFVYLLCFKFQVCIQVVINLHEIYDSNFSFDSWCQHLYLIYFISIDWSAYAGIFPRHTNELVKFVCLFKHMHYLITLLRSGISVWMNFRCEWTVTYTVILYLDWKFF